MSLIQFVSAMHSEHSAKIQDVQRQLQLQEKDFQRQLQLQNKQQLQLRQQLQNQDDAFSQVQHQLSQLQEEVQGNSRGQLQTVRTCQRQQGQLQQGQRQAQPPNFRTLQPTTQRLAQPPAQLPAQTPAQPQPPVQLSVQPPAQTTVQRAAQPQRLHELTALVPSWAQRQRSNPATPAVSATVLPEEQERRKRSANVVMYGLSGDSSACLRQAAQEVLQAVNLPHAGRHVVAVEPLPTQGPHPPVVVCFDDPCWSTRLLRSKRSLRRVPALARVYIAEHLTRAQQAERSSRQPRFAAAQQLGCAFWRGTEVMLHRRDAAPGCAPEVFAC